MNCAMVWKLDFGYCYLFVIWILVIAICLAFGIWSLLFVLHLGFSIRLPFLLGSFLNNRVEDFYQFNGFVLQMPAFRFKGFVPIGIEKTQPVFRLLGFLSADFNSQSEVFFADGFEITALPYS